MPTLPEPTHGLYIPADPNVPCTFVTLTDAELAHLWRCPTVSAAITRVPAAVLRVNAWPNQQPINRRATQCHHRPDIPLRGDAVLQGYHLDRRVITDLSDAAIHDLRVGMGIQLDIAPTLEGAR